MVVLTSIRIHRALGLNVALHRLFVLALSMLGFLSVTTAVSAAEVAPTELRIGFQKSAVNLVILKQQAAVEHEFPNTKVSWIEFPAGPQILEALSVGSLDFGFTGDTPPIFAQAAGKALYFVGTEPPKPRSSAILVPANSTLHSLADLKGKKVAFQRGSSAHYLVLQALSKAGLQWSDIKPIYLEPSDARAAFEQGSIDAWAIWDPYNAATEVAFKARALADGRGLSDNNSFYLASQSFVQHYPQAIKTLLKLSSGADAFVQSNRADAIKKISAYSGLDPATVALALSRRPVSPATLLPAQAIASEQAIADRFFQVKLIPAQIRVADIVWKPAH